MTTYVIFPSLFFWHYRVSRVCSEEEIFRMPYWILDFPLSAVRGLMPDKAEGKFGAMKNPKSNMTNGKSPLLAS